MKELNVGDNNLMNIHDDETPSYCHTTHGVNDVNVHDVILSKRQSPQHTVKYCVSNNNLLIDFCEDKSIARLDTCEQFCQTLDQDGIDNEIGTACQNDINSHHIQQTDAFEKQNRSVSSNNVSEAVSNSSLSKANSLSQLNTFLRSSKEIIKKGQRAISFHEDSAMGPLGMFQQIKSGSHGNITGNREIENVDSRKEIMNDMFRKAVSLCELQNVKFKKNLAKLGQKFSSTDAIMIDEDDDTDKWFPRLSYEDCSSCTSCRSRSSSYHSLLYDLDTASNYQIYQPTVCDVIDTENNIGDEDDDVTIETSKMAAIKSKSSRILKQSYSTIGNFKEKLKRSTKERE